MSHDANSPYNRAAHDGEQAISTVTGLQAALDLKLEDADMQSALTTALADYTETADLGGSQFVLHRVWHGWSRKCAFAQYNESSVLHQQS